MEKTQVANCPPPPGYSSGQNEWHPEFEVQRTFQPPPNLCNAVNPLAWPIVGYSYVAFRPAPVALPAISTLQLFFWDKETEMSFVVC